MGWCFGRRGNWRSAWPGNGPYGNLPPWQRPGWMFGRGYRWLIKVPGFVNPEDELRYLEEYRKWLEGDIKALHEELRLVKDRIEELRKLIEGSQ